MDFAYRFAGFFAVSVVLAGCQQQMMSDDRIASAVAGTLGVPVGDIIACTINGGGLLAAGMINPPTCNPIVAQR